MYTFEHSHCASFEFITDETRINKWLITLSLVYLACEYNVHKLRCIDSIDETCTGRKKERIVTVGLRFYIYTICDADCCRIIFRHAICSCDLGLGAPFLCFQRPIRERDILQD